MQVVQRTSQQFTVSWNRWSYLAGFVISGFFLLAPIPVVQAKVVWETHQSLQKANTALRGGALGLWGKHLLRAKQSYILERSVIPSKERDRMRLSLLFQLSKYYEWKGQTPPYRNVAGFSNVTDLRQYIRTYEASNRALKRSMSYRRVYHKLVSRVAYRSKTTPSLAMQHSYRHNQKLHSKFQTQKQYVSLLYQTLFQWEKRSTVWAEIQKNPGLSGPLKRLKRWSSNASQNSLLQKRNVLLAMEQSRQLLSKQTQALQERGRVAHILISVGAGTMALGAAGAISGTVLMAHIEQDISFGVNEASKLDTLGFRLAVGFGVTFLVGTSLVIAGVVHRPHTYEQGRALLKSHAALHSYKKGKPHFVFAQE